MSDAEPEWITLHTAEVSAGIDPLGAQLSILRDAQGRDLLWNGDAAFWTGRAPLLFPIVGSLADGCYRVNSTVYRLPRHGFARTRMFTVVSATATSACLRLRADEATLAVYPFRFELTVEFEVRGATLRVTTRVGNLGDAPMLASVGYHPAFRWPLPYGQPRAAHTIDFEADEPADVRRLDTQGLLSPTRHPTPIVKRRLQLQDGLFTDDVVIFDSLASRRLTYGAAGGPRLRVEFPDATFLGLWSKPGAPFVCIEPWHGVADLSGFAGEIADKTGIFMLGPGETQPLTMEITLLPQPESA